MNNLYQYLVNAGIDEKTASWGCVIVLALVVMWTVIIICRIIPRNK